MGAVSSILFHRRRCHAVCPIGYELYAHTSESCFRLTRLLSLLTYRINYRHFEDDNNPRVIKESGFRHLDRVVDLCAKHHIYTVIDLHAAPGGRLGNSFI